MPTHTIYNIQLFIFPRMQRHNEPFTTLAPLLSGDTLLRLLCDSFCETKQQILFDEQRTRYVPAVGLAKKPPKFRLLSLCSHFYSLRLV
jgi:hypothetical protein